MPGLRERKKAATRLAIRDAGMRLFDERGFGGTTVDDIAEAAGVSRATVFTYFPTKEEIVFGDAASAVEGLAARLRERDEPTIAASAPGSPSSPDGSSPNCSCSIAFATRPRPSPPASAS